MKNRSPKWIYLSLFLIITVQQSIVASSSVWIKKFTDGLEIQHINFKFILLFFASLTIPYVVGIFCSIFAKRLEIGIFQSLISKMTFSFQNKPQLYTAEKIRSDVEGCITSESWALSRDMSMFAYDSTSSLLNVILNLSAITLFIEKQFAFYLLLGFGLSCLFLKMCTAQIAKQTQLAQHRKVDVQNTLLNFWDNTVLGNRIHSDLWRQRNLKSVISWREAEIQKSVSQHVASAGASILSILPFVIFFLNSISQGRFSPAQLLVHAAVLYRMFQIINSASFLYSIVSEASSLFSRQQIIKSILLPKFSFLDLMKRIKPDALACFEPSTGRTWTFTSADSFVRDMKTRKSGRLSLTGNNGAGKSTLLLYLKSRIGGNFLPASHRLENTETDHLQKSTGQKQFAQILLLLENSEGPIFLDEWAANIDVTFREDISKILDAAAKNRLVIEVNQSA